MYTGTSRAYPEQADSGAAAHLQPRPARLLAGPDRRRRCRRRRDRRPRVPPSGAGDGRAARTSRGHQLDCYCFVSGEGTGAIVVGAHPRVR